MADEIKNRESLLAYRGAFEETCRGLANDPDAALASIRRLARHLEVCACRRGDKRLDAAAAALADARDENVEARLEDVQHVLLELTSASLSETVRVLVVESDPTLATTIQSSLSASHREVFLATDAASAEKLAGRQWFAMIVLGLALPDMDGRDLLVRLRSHSRTMNVPVFVVAPALNLATAIECLALGADGYFDTPLDPNLLAAEVATRLQVKQETEGRMLSDPLTGLTNVSGFGEAFDRLHAFCKRSGSPLSIGLVELAGLRAINESSGHEAGDACLVHLSAVIRESLRQSDVVARWDGDAFVLLFPNTPADGAVVALGKIRERLKNSPSGVDGVELDFVAGVSEVGEMTRAGDAAAEAERVLNHARRGGAGSILSTADTRGSHSNVVMLVEDDEISAAVIRHRLTRDGFDVRRFVDGEEALEAAGDLNATLVILDVKLPGMDGFEVLRRLRSSPRFEGIPIAIVSALGREEDVVRGLELGADDYIPKPFSTAELRARVQSMLEKRGIPCPDAPRSSLEKSGV